MSAAVVMAGLKVVVDANGYTVKEKSAEDVAINKGAYLLQTGVVPVHTENATRHEGEFLITLYDEIKPKRRYSQEVIRVGRIETLMKAIDAAYQSWSVVCNVDSATTRTEGEYRITEMMVTALYAV